MATANNGAKKKFVIQIIKPSHYDNDGYVIQWLRAFIPSNSLACLYALVQDASERKALGDDVEIVVDAYDESHTVIRTKKIIQLIKQGHRGIVLLAGVQTNQFPRAADLAREFIAAGVPVAIGGFHISGCMAMLPELPPDIKAVQEMGVTLYAGETEGRMEQFLKDAWNGRLQSVYNFMLDLPDMREQVMPILPKKVLKGYGLVESPFDAGRGCPFTCSFCTIINVQGRKSRHRTADDVERVIRANLAQGVHKFFITDDDFARNKNWEPIFDRMIEMREKEGLFFKFLMQVDTQCYKIPRFVDKAARAGCSRVFIGLENINPENLAAANKVQNHVSQYRKMLQAWHDKKVLTIAGYILGFPADTPESIERDIKIIQRELPVDILEFFYLTPLPGSADHKALYEKGVWMEPDMNKYDLEHPCTHHPRMSAAEWRGIYERAWHLYYSREHVETLLRRAKASGIKTGRMAWGIDCYYGSFRFERLHPLQCGIFRRKVRTQRRPGMPRENALIFYPKRVWQTLRTYVSLYGYALWLELLRRKVERDPNGANYTDTALQRDFADLPILSDAA